MSDHVPIIFEIDGNEDIDRPIQTRSVTALSSSSLVRLMTNLNRSLALVSTPINPEEQIIQNRGRRQIPKTPPLKVAKQSTSKRQHGLMDAPTTPPPNDSIRAGREFPKPQESPFTKCLRGIEASPPRPIEQPNVIVESLRRRLLLSPSETNFNSSNETSDYDSSTPASSLTKSQSFASYRKFHYYSPISRKLRSSDTPVPSLSISSSNISEIAINDSGLDINSPSPQFLTSIDTDTGRPMKTAKLGPATSFQSLDTESLDNISVNSFQSSASSQRSSKSTTVNRARRRFRF